MKNKVDKHIKILAQKIVEAEKEILLGKNVQKNQQKIENIVSSLSFEDMMIMDEFIYEKNILTR